MAEASGASPNQTTRESAQIGLDAQIHFVTGDRKAELDLRALEHGQ